MAKRTKPRIARVDSHTPEIGLFKVRSKKGPRLQAEEYKRDLGDGIMLEYVTPYPLSDRDMLVFVAAIGICTKSPHAIDATAKEIQKTLWDRFLTEGAAVDREAASARTTAYAIAEAAGLGWGGDQSKQIGESLKRLSSVSAFWRKGSRTMSASRLLSYAHDEESGELAIGVSPMLAKAILGSSRVYTRVSLDEMRQLSHPAARILHLVLSNRLNVGGSVKKRDHSFRIDALANAAYGEPSSPAVKRKRRGYIRKALEELGSLSDWLVTINQTGEIASVTRWEPKNIEDLQVNIKRQEAIQRQLDGIDPPDEIN